MSALDLDGQNTMWVSAMKARAMIEGAAYGPDDLKVVGQAFDDAWEEMHTTTRTTFYEPSWHGCA